MGYFDISKKYCAITREHYNLMMWHCDITIRHSGITAGHCDKSIGHCHGIVKLCNATMNIVMHQSSSLVSQWDIAMKEHDDFTMVYCAVSIWCHNGTLLCQEEIVVSHC